MMTVFCVLFVAIIDSILSLSEMATFVPFFFLILLLRAVMVDDSKAKVQLA